MVIKISKIKLLFRVRTKSGDEIFNDFLELLLIVV